MRAVAANPKSNPFPGLRPFREDEEHLFFGRENQIDAMVNKLAATRFLAVVGTSGSGKSSLVNCGLRPALRQGLMAPAGTAWRMAQFRPGNDPIGAMAGTTPPMAVGCMCATYKWTSIPWCILRALYLYSAATRRHRIATLANSAQVPHLREA